MATVLGRVALGISAALAVVGGGMLTAMVIVYFGANDYVPELSEYGGWGIIAGMCALGIYTFGAAQAPLIMRIGLGLGLAGAGYVFSMIAGYLVSLTADRGGPRGNLEDGTIGFIWLLAGLYFLTRLALRKWPVVQEPMGVENQEPLRS